MSDRPGPLKGVRAVTCSTAQAGTVPYALMADLGAEVIKIEVPEKGDRSRNSGPVKDHPSSYFETNNRGVKSVTLNLKADEGLKILHDLVKTADIFGQNFRPGAAERNGFGYEELKKINPSLVYVSVSGYGTHGPNGHRAGVDAVGQALGGVAHAFSTPGQVMRTGIASVADESCAILTFGGLLAALYCAKTTGVGQKVETSLVGSAVRLMGWTLTTTMWRNAEPITGARITGSAERPSLAACFNDCDGKGLVFQLGGRSWEDAMGALGFYETFEERGIADLGLAVTSEEKRKEILGTLAELFATGPRDKWIEMLRAQDIVGAPINSLLEASNDPDVLANGYISEMEYPEYGKTVKVHGSPWQFSETPAKIGKAPELGEHNQELLQELGYKEEEIKKLKRDGVV